MLKRRGLPFGAALIFVCMIAFIAPAASGQPSLPTAEPAVVVCDQPPGNPAPGTAAWEKRDLNNLECATQRQQDIVSNPAFMRMWAIKSGENDPGTETAAIFNQFENTDPTGALGDVAMTKIGDPFRDPTTWQESGRGQQTPLTINSTDGAHLNARLYWPNGPGPFPGVVMTPGLQAYNEIYEWLGEGLAEAGYMVLIPDPQLQGGSDDLPRNPDGTIACGFSGCSDTSTDPTSDEPQVLAVASALDFLVSTPTDLDLDGDGGNPHAANAQGTLLYNPEWRLLSPMEIGVAGHSNGARAVTSAGQQDVAGTGDGSGKITYPIKAVVSMDNVGQTLGSGVHIHVPTLYFDVDYPFPSLLEPQNPKSPPNPERYIDDTFSQTVAAGVDSMLIVPRASTHYEFDYLPFPSSLQASRNGERVAFYYILAWFDRYLNHNIARDGHTATQRLIATYFDSSADTSSIGTGTYNSAAAATDPTDPAAGNVPYKIEGTCVSNLLSFYYQSAYWLDGGKLKNYHMENPLGCP
jgi:dienelactone hydrolase